MNGISNESIALHIIRYLAHGMGKPQGQGASIQNLRYWWTISLGQRGKGLERGLVYVSQCRWVENGPDNRILLTTVGSEKGGVSR
jgi:hypothetical protein